MLIPAYCARCLRASRIGALDTMRTPLNGLFISSIRKNPLETATAKRARLTIPAAPCGANRPKLRKMSVAHAVSTIRSTPCAHYIHFCCGGGYFLNIFETVL